MAADAPPEDALLLRPLTREDVEAVGALAKAAGRNVGAVDYARFLDLEGARGYALEHRHEILAAATSMRYFEHGFLGPVVTRASDDAVGLSVALLAHTVENLRREGVQLIEAEAAAPEQAILQRMGFEKVRSTLVWERAGAEAGAAHATRPMETHHLLDIGVLDADIKGHGRKQYIAALQRDLPAGARVVESEGELVGYALLRRSPRGAQLGPVVTRSDDAATARALIADALRAAPPGPIVALTPDEPAARELLLAAGFTEVGVLARMRAGILAPVDERRVATEWVLGGRLTG